LISLSPRWRGEVTLYPVARRGAASDATSAGAPRKMVLGSWERLREPDSVVIDKAGYILLFPDEPLELARELEMNDRHRDIRTEGLNATHKSGVGRKAMNLYGPKQLVESARTRPDEQQTNQGPRSGARHRY